jgi:hypothetical protein
VLKTSGLTVRQYERAGIELSVELVICDDHSRQVRFSPSAASAGQHAVRAIAKDISAGGMGLEGRHYLPRMTEGIVRVFDPSPTGIASDGTPILEIAFEHRVKVRRVWLTSREPTYATGIAFVNPAPDIDLVIARLLDRLQISRGGKSTKSETSHA